MCDRGASIDVTGAAPVDSTRVFTKSPSLPVSASLQQASPVDMWRLSIEDDLLMRLEGLIVLDDNTCNNNATNMQERHHPAPNTTVIQHQDPHLKTSLRKDFQAVGDLRLPPQGPSPTPQARKLCRPPLPRPSPSATDAASPLIPTLSSRSSEPPAGYQGVKPWFRQDRSCTGFLLQAPTHRQRLASAPLPAAGGPSFHHPGATSRHKDPPSSPGQAAAAAWGHSEAKKSAGAGKDDARRGLSGPFSTGKLPPSQQMRTPQPQTQPHPRPSPIASDHDDSSQGCCCRDWPAGSVITSIQQQLVRFPLRQRLLLAAQDISRHLPVGDVGSPAASQAGQGTAATAPAPHQQQTAETAAAMKNATAAAHRGFQGLVGPRLAASRAARMLIRLLDVPARPTAEEL